MSNIIKLRTKSDNVLDFLEEAIDIVKKENVDNIMIAFKLKQEDSNVMTGYCNLNMGEKQELLGHIQVDIVKDMIEQNYITP